MAGADHPKINTAIAEGEMLNGRMSTIEIYRKITVNIYPVNSQPSREVSLTQQLVVFFVL